MFKANNKNTRTTSTKSFSSVSVAFKQVNVSCASTEDEWKKVYSTWDSDGFIALFLKYTNFFCKHNNYKDTYGKSAKK